MNSLRHTIRIPIYFLRLLRLSWQQYCTNDSLSLSSMESNTVPVHSYDGDTKKYGWNILLYIPYSFDVRARSDLCCTHELGLCNHTVLVTHMDRDINRRVPGTL